MSSERKTTRRIVKLSLHLRDIANARAAHNARFQKGEISALEWRWGLKLWNDQDQQALAQLSALCEGSEVTPPEPRRTRVCKPLRSIVISWCRHWLF